MQITAQQIADINLAHFVAIVVMGLLALMAWSREEYRDSCPTCRSERQRKREAQAEKKHQEWHRSWGTKHCPWCKEKR